MQYTKLPHSSLEISKLCLGTMTFGEQNTQAEAFSQLDYALERGINFIDTAEMYPVPPKAETQGKTEEFIGNWLENPVSVKRSFWRPKSRGHATFPISEKIWRSIIVIFIKRSTTASAA